MQEHAAVKANGICTCLTEAMGKGGGQIPMTVEFHEIHNPAIRRQGSESDGEHQELCPYDTRQPYE